MATGKKTIHVSKWHRVVRDSEWNEWSVVPRFGEGKEERTYHCGDKQDAMGTCAMMDREQEMAHD